MKKVILLFMFLLPLSVYASEEITENCQILVNGENIYNIHDTKYSTYTDFTSEDILTINCEESIKHVYIYYNEASSTGSIISDIESKNIGENGFLHELIALDSMTNSVSLKYSENFSISDIFIFGEEIPSWVERWEKLDKADMLIIPTHFADDVLYFAGLIPSYIDKGKNIQVIYFMKDTNNNRKYHEILESLWAQGVKYYPEISNFPETSSNSIEESLESLNTLGFTEDDLIKYIVTMIRKYKPDVIVSHSENGEDNNENALNTYILKKSVNLINDINYETDNYDAFTLKKVYLHMYDQNQIVLNYDEPLTYFDNKTAYEVNKEAFNKHYLLYNTQYKNWLFGDNEEYTSFNQIENNSPLNFGLYYSSVGEDVLKNDMFENITTTIDKQLDSDYKVREYEIQIPTYVKKIYKKNILFTVGIGLMILSGGGLIIITIKHKRKSKRKIS